MSTSPKVLIVGAGLGGITLALLLERINIEYEIFERAPVVKPLGAAMSIGPNILPLFEQLGMVDDIMKLALPGRTMKVFNENMDLIGQTQNTASMEERCGYPPIMFSRPDFYRLLLSKIPPGRIHFNKRVLSVGQSDTGALIRCADGWTHEGDLVIGADGAYSAVRQSLYGRLEKEGKLPKSDTQSMNVGYSCMVGTTLPQDPEKYPILKDNFANFGVVVAEGKPHSVKSAFRKAIFIWTIIQVPGNRLCFGIVIQLHGQEKEETFRNSEWGPDSIDALVAQVRDHKVPFGGTLGDLIDATPKELISKVHLEEKLFETWTNGRIALIGDGAINAMQDAVIVANCLYDMKSTSGRDIELALQDYKAQRYPHAKKQVHISALVGKVLYGQSKFEKFMRRAVFNWLPTSFEERSFIKSAAYRPQATFLPFIPNPAKLHVTPQKMSKRYAEEQRKKETRGGVAAALDGKYSKSLDSRHY
ncbi:hypothetical protein BGZ99_005955 [Dissophora globulifera]|uniref:FAD-binding domain-containing protein n=1 Tax=Dissophora globulifera TaxID=979702 RepID=A0A9P6RG54_9FUNG|nr:hypothetical protein BGZ99_005955 [Dissophora globulifera]